MQLIELRQTLNSKPILEDFQKSVLQADSRYSLVPNFNQAVRVFECLAYIKKQIIEHPEIFTLETRLKRAPNGMAFHLETYTSPEDAALGLGQLVQNTEAAILVVHDSPKQIETVIRFKILESAAGCMEMRLNEFIRYAAMISACGKIASLNDYMSDCLSSVDDDSTPTERINRVVDYFSPYIGNLMQIVGTENAPEIANLSWCDIKSYLVNTLSHADSEWLCLLSVLFNDCEWKRTGKWYSADFKNDKTARFYQNYIKSLLSEDLYNQFSQSRIKKRNNNRYGFSLSIEQFNFISALRQDSQLTASALPTENHLLQHLIIVSPTVNYLPVNEKSVLELSPAVPFNLFPDLFAIDPKLQSKIGKILIDCYFEDLNIIAFLKTWIVKLLNINSRETIIAATDLIAAFNVVVDSESSDRSQGQELEACFILNLKASIIKTIRADEHAFFREWLLGATRSPVQRVHHPLRPGERKKWTVDAKGVHLSEKQLPLYTIKEKMFFSQHQSCSLVLDILQNCYFGHRNRSVLAGIQIDLQGISKAYLLGRRFFARDVGTYYRPYDFDDPSDAKLYYLNKVETERPVLFNQLSELVRAMINYEKNDYWNELHLLLNWQPKYSRVCIFQNNLESRLLAQDYARLIAIRVKERAAEFASTVYADEYAVPDDYTVPITFYIPNSDKNNEIYTPEMQLGDRQRAISIHNNALPSLFTSDSSFEYLLGLDQKQLQNALLQYNKSNVSRLACLFANPQNRHLAQSVIERLGANQQFFADLSTKSIYFDPCVYPVYLCIIAGVPVEFLSQVFHMVHGYLSVAFQKRPIELFLIPALCQKQYAFLPIILKFIVTDNQVWERYDLFYLFYEYKLNQKCLLLHILESGNVDYGFSIFCTLLEKFKDFRQTTEFLQIAKFFIQLDKLNKVNLSNLDCLQLFEILGNIAVENKQQADLFNAVLELLDSKLPAEKDQTIPYLMQPQHHDFLEVIDKKLVIEYFKSADVFSKYLKTAKTADIQSLLERFTQAKDDRLLPCIMKIHPSEFAQLTDAKRNAISQTLLEYYIVICKAESESLLNTVMDFALPRFFMDDITIAHKTQAAQYLKGLILNTEMPSPNQRTIAALDHKELRTLAAFAQVHIQNRAEVVRPSISRARIQP